MPIFLNTGEYESWLTSEIDQASAFFKQHPGPFLGEPAPLVRAPKVAAEPRAKDEVPQRELGGRVSQVLGVVPWRMFGGLILVFDRPLAMPGFQPGLAVKNRQRRG